MCYALPGPRCSTHVEQRQNQTIARIRDLKEQRDKLVKLGWDKSENKARRDNVQKLNDRIAAEEKKSEHLHEQWVTTPKGLSSIAALYREAKRSGNEEFAEMARERFMEAYGKRQEQFKAYDKAQEEKKARAADFGEAMKRSAEANAWKDSKPKETADAWMVATDSKGNVEVYLHGGVSPHDARQSYRNAGFDPEGVTFIPAEEPVPALKDMPYMDYEEFERKHAKGEIKVVKGTGFTVSMTSDGYNTGQAINGSFVNGIKEPMVVRRQDAEDNSSPSLVMLPGPPRPVTHEEGIILANAAGSGGMVYLRDYKGRNIGSFDRRTLHGDLTRGKVKPSKPKARQFDPDLARKDRIESGYYDVDPGDYDTRMDDGRGRPRGRREPIMDMGMN